MVFTNASNLFNQAMLISIQEHMHKVGFLNRGNSATEINRLYTQSYCWALHKMTEKNPCECYYFQF